MNIAWIIYIFLASGPFKSIYSQLFFFSLLIPADHNISCSTVKKIPFWRGKVPPKSKDIYHHYEIIIYVLFTFSNILQILYQHYFLTPWQNLCISWKWFPYLEMKPSYLPHSENRFIVLSSIFQTVQRRWLWHICAAVPKSWQCSIDLMLMLTWVLIRM